MKSIPLRALVVGMLVSLGVIFSVAISAADSHPTEIILVLDSGTNQFEYGGATQPINIGKAECAITSASRTGGTSNAGGSIIVMSASTYDNGGRLVQDSAPIGLVEDGLGVNLRGKGNGQDCGRVDFLELDASGNPLSERLKFELGDAISGQMLDGVTFDLEAKYAPTVHFWFYRNRVLIDDTTHVITGGSDSGPDSKFRDKYRVVASTPEGPFDAIEISMDSGGVSVEGGATWIYSDVPGDEPENNRTVFHLVDATASATIEDSTTGDVGSVIAADEPFTWTWTVTNTGDLALSNIAVGVSVNGDSPVDVDCDATTLVSGMMDCTLTIVPAGAGDIALTASLSATSEFGDLVFASVDSDYYGSDPAIDIDVTTTDGVQTPDDGLYIATGDDVTWTYTVTNTGNVGLSTVAVTDDQLGTISYVSTYVSGDTDEDDILDTTETWIYTASGTAVVGDYANEATVFGTDPLGTEVTSSDTSDYFGSNPEVSIEATLDDPLIDPGDTVDWLITVTNSGNVALYTVIVTEDGTEVCDLGTIEPGLPGEPTTATCEYSADPEAGYTETSFRVEGTAPPEIAVAETSGIVSYIGVLACGDGDIEGEPGLADTPLVSFIVGPDNGTKLAPPCSVPVHITSNNSGGTQTVSVAPPSGYEWGGVTGVVTIQWDAEDATLGPIARTYQAVSPSSSVPIPWCAEIVGVSPVQDAGSDLWYYDLDPTGALYPAATGGGDTCLVFQHTENVDDDGVIRTQTTEVFYIWNDPIFLR